MPYRLLATVWILLLAGCGRQAAVPPPRETIVVPAEAPEAVRQAAGGLNSPEPLTRAHAADQLGRLEQAGEHAMACLLAALRDPHPLVRAAAARALGRVGSSAAAGPLVARLADQTEDRDVRSSAAEALGQLQAAEAVGPLSAALNDTVWHLRYHATLALKRIGDPQAVPSLEQTARYDPDHRVRAAAEEALQRMRPTGSGLAPKSEGTPAQEK